jgi:hypothetical protein
MKRLEPEPPPDSPVPSTPPSAEAPAGESGRVFKVTQVPTPPAGPPTANRAQPPPPAASEEEPIWSEEAFGKLSGDEQYKVFQGQAYEIKQLRRKLRKNDHKRYNKLEAEMQEAHRIIEDNSFELEDQRYILDNLVKALNQGVLTPNTLPFNHICTILRDKLNTTLTNGPTSCIKLPEKTIAISKKEEEEYLHLPRCVKLFRALVGRQDPENPPVPHPPREPNVELEQYLQMQAGILKSMTYEQFQRSLEMSKKPD